MALPVSIDSPNRILKPPPVTVARVLWFWLPLVAMWLIMAVEQPALSAVVTRLPDAVRNLAAFGQSFALALIVESPIIMMLTAATALASNRLAYRRLLAFTALLAFALTALHLLLALTPLYAFVLRGLIGVPEQIVETSRVAFLLMAPWTPAIAFRRLWEGLMIRAGRPERVTMVIVIRLATTMAVLLAGLWLQRWPGAYVAGAALSVGVTVGALAAYFLARPSIARMDAEGELLSWGALSRFYAPLALTSLITMVAQPILAFGLSRAPLPLESLAIWPVVMAFIFIGRSVGISYQEVTVALLKEEGSAAPLRRVALTVALALLSLFVLLALTPGAMLYYRRAAGLLPELAQMAIWPTLLLAPVPALNVLLSWQRGLLVHRRRTPLIGQAVAVNLVALGTMMIAGVFWGRLPGAVMAAIALSVSMGIESLFLAWVSRR